MPGLGLIGFVCKKKKFKTYLQKFQDRFNKFTPEANGNCVRVSVSLQTVLALMTIHAGLVTQTVGAFVQVYSQSVNFFLFILDTASF